MIYYLLKNKSLYFEHFTDIFLTGIISVILSFHICSMPSLISIYFMKFSMLSSLKNIMGRVVGGHETTRRYPECSLITETVTLQSSEGDYYSRQSTVDKVIMRETGK